MEKKLTLKQMFLNKIDDSPRGYAEELAKISGSYSSGSNLKKVLKSEDKEFDSFNGLVKMVQYVFGEDEQKLMEQYSKEIDVNNKNARYMLEYLSSHRILDSLKQLIDKMLECKNKESKEWARVYSIQHEWSLNYHNLDIISILKTLNEFKTNIPELNTLISIMKCNSCYKQKMYKISFEISRDIKFQIENLKDDFVKCSYTVKLNEIMSYLSLRVRNEPETARKYAEDVLELNIGETFNGYAKYIIGYSYFFTSYEKAKENLCESVKIYTSIDRLQAAEDVKEEIELLDVLWDKDIFTVYYSEKYKYYWLARKNKSFDIESTKLDSDDPFYFLIKGMKENNTNILQQSLIRFIKRGDMFLANLPKVELLKRGFNEDVLNDLLSIYVS